MKRVHDMPFGARYGAEATRFALWAPGCDAVEVALGRDGSRRVPLQPAPDGWHSATVQDVRAGEAYAFRVKPDAPAVPDPASRSNPWDVNGPSAVVDPGAFDWDDAAWRGRPWNEAVLYEMHLGTFTREGTFAAAIERLDYLADLGVTALEVMPVSDFAGRRNWGYDGVLPFAPDAAYGTPADFKRLVAEAHRRGLMVLLDVVYNHFGPEGNYLSLYAPQFFNEAHRTPWGAAINFDGPDAGTVRDFFVHNALYWLEEYHLDGLRLDAVHAIADESPRHLVADIAAALAAGPGRARHVHLVLENERNEASFLDRGGPHAVAQWNDDAHHALHVLLTGERDGYYRGYAERPLWHLGRTLTEGFSYQGEGSPHHGGKPRGEPCGHLPLQAFVAFLQNHDQIGNRALGERIAALAAPEAMRLAVATLCLAPSVPLLFMGEEFATPSPFLFFCDFAGELGHAVREGRRREFAAFDRFKEPAARERIPDPLADATFLACKLPWDALECEPHAACHAHYRTLLRLRAREIAPRLADTPAQARFEVVGDSGLAVDWTLGDGARLALRANYGSREIPAMPSAPGALLHAEGPRALQKGMAPWGGTWTLEPA